MNAKIQMKFSTLNITIYYYYYVLLLQAKQKWGETQHAANEKRNYKTQKVFGISYACDFIFISLETYSNIEHIDKMKWNDKMTKRKIKKKYRKTPSIISTPLKLLCLISFIHFTVFLFLLKICYCCQCEHLIFK